MKKLFEKIAERAKRLALPAAVGFALMIGSNVTFAQSIPLKIYFLTNSLPGTNYLSITNGAIPLQAGAIYNVNAQPFQIWRGRGFTFNASLWGTNPYALLTQGTVTAAIREGVVHYNPGTTTLVTNWTATNLVASLNVTVTNQASEQLISTNFNYTTVDNMTLGQLMSLVNNNATNTVWWDPTNSYIGVYP